MKLSAAVRLLAFATSSITSAVPKNSCLALTHDARYLFQTWRATLISSTPIPVGGMVVSGVSNQVAFCQVVASVAYGGNETLNFQLWLPDTSMYKGRFMAVGGGGMAGVIDNTNMMLQLNSGFAVAGGDSGHLASQNNNGSGAPDTYLPYLHNMYEVKAWIHNAISLFTPAAKSLTTCFYGHEPRYSYYDGCSTGGAQGFALAQYHPTLFDGIVAGSPGNWYSHLALSFLWNGLKSQNSAYLAQTALDLITSAVLDKCDTIDGVKDGLIENPLLCNFDIETLACSSTSISPASCLTPDQIGAVNAIYAGPVSTLDGKQIYPGFSYGSESGWLEQEQLLANAFSIPILQNLVYDNLDYNSSTFNFGSDVRDVDAKAGAYIDEISSDLSSFRKSGGKMLVTQGWADQLNAATWPIEHMRQLKEFFHGDISDFFNLFMIPGAGHCGASANYPNVPATYLTIEKLIDWVEKGEKPANVLSINPPSGANITRLLCPWPKTARFSGNDQSSAESYVCK